MKAQNTTTQWWFTMWGMWLVWTLATTLGYLCGALLGAIVYVLLLFGLPELFKFVFDPWKQLLLSYCTVGIASATVASMFGAAQSWVIDRYLHVGDAWMASTLAGWASLAILTGCVYPFPTPSTAQTASIFLIGILGAEAFQSLLLYRYYSLYRWQVHAYTMTWLLSIVFLLQSLMMFSIWNMLSNGCITGFIISSMIKRNSERHR